MSFLSDLHMHTVFSDGLSVSEDYIQEAVNAAFCLSVFRNTVLPLSIFLSA